jgi:hypothetical protein
MQLKSYKNIDNIIFILYIYTLDVDPDISAISRTYLLKTQYKYPHGLDGYYIYKMFSLLSLYVYRGYRHEFE